MSYQLTHFDDLEFRGVHNWILSPQQDHSPFGSGGALIDSIGGFFDQFGNDLARAGRQPISITHLVLGEKSYLVDHLGNHIVDHNGNRIIAGDDAQMLRAQLNAVRAKLRKRGTLWRTRLDDNLREWKTARLLRMGQPQNVRDRKNMATVTLEFESPDDYWHAEEPLNFATYAVAGTHTQFVVGNPGELVNDAVVTITCTSGTITHALVGCFDLDILWSWGNDGGTLTLGESLVVDGGEQAISEGATAAYGDFLLLGDAKGFMPIEQGTWLFFVELTGGNGTIDLTFYPQTP